MNASEIDPDAVYDATENGDNSVEMRHGSFVWNRDDRQGFTLELDHLDVPRGSLMAIVGKVGCGEDIVLDLTQKLSFLLTIYQGKSSFLSALLGEMAKLRGQVRVSGSIALVPQVPWILNATVKDNILFGKPMENQ